MTRNRIARLEKRAAKIACPVCGRAGDAGAAEVLASEPGDRELAELEKLVARCVSRCWRCGRETFDFAGSSDDDLRRMLDLIEPHLRPELAALTRDVADTEAPR